MLKQYPKNIKYKKNHKVSNKFMKLLEFKQVMPEYGNVALQSLNSGKLTYRQVEACRRTLRRSLKSIGEFWIRVSITRPVTKKPLGTRMGKGKGATSHWIAPIRKGQVLFEIAGVPIPKAIKIFFKAKSKLPIKTKIKLLLF